MLRFSEYLSASGWTPAWPLPNATTGDFKTRRPTGKPLLSKNPSRYAHLLWARVFGVMSHQSWDVISLAMIEYHKELTSTFFRLFPCPIIGANWQAPPHFTTSLWTPFWEYGGGRQYCVFKMWVNKRFGYGGVSWAFCQEVLLMAKKALCILSW